MGEQNGRPPQLDSMQNQNSSDSLTMKQSRSGVEGADPAETMMKLQTRIVAFRAALEATSKSIPPSLADFLR